MKLFLLERFTRCVSRCALFFICSIFLVSVVLLVIALFVRHPSECLRNPIQGLDVESSKIGENLRKYRQFGESTTWQPKFSKITTAYTADHEQSPNSMRAELIEFSTPDQLVNPSVPASSSPSSSSGSKPIILPSRQAAPSTKQQQRLLDVAACSGWLEGGLIAKNSLPLSYKSASNDDLLSPQSIWALCQLAERIEKSPNYAAVCRRRPLTNEAIAEEIAATSSEDTKISEGDHHPTVDTTSCCPVISIHTFVQMVFPHQDPCQQATKVTLSQTENLRSDIFFCQRTANDPRFANESYQFCVDFRQQIGAFMTFLADKNFLKETQSLTLSNIWLPMKDETESHDQPGEEHDLEVVERLVEEIREQNASSTKLHIIYEVAANPNVANTQRRRKMFDFSNEFVKSIETISLVGIASLASLLFLIATANCSMLRIIGMIFVYICIFSCAYFTVFVAYGNQQPSFVGLLLPAVYTTLLLFDAFFNFNASMASANAASRNDVRTFQQTLQSGVRASFWPFTHMTLIQTTLTFSLMSFAVSEITVIQQICQFLVVLSGFVYGFLILWLPASCALSFRNKQSVSLPVIADVDTNPDTKICCLSCEIRCRTAIKAIAYTLTPFYEKTIDALAFLLHRFNIFFCFLPVVIITSSGALLFRTGVPFETKNGDLNLVSLFTTPAQVLETTNPLIIFLSGSANSKTTFAYEDHKKRFKNVLKDTNRSDVDPFFDCANAFQRISFVFQVSDLENGGNDDILFTPEAQLWFKRFCNESRHWLETDGGDGEAGRNRVSVHALRECAVDRLIPFFQSRNCQVLRQIDGHDIFLDASPCCATYRFPWEPAIYKQCLRNYVIDQIFKTGTEPNIDLRFSKDGTTETGFAVEYDVTFLNTRHKGNKTTSHNDSNSCDLMLNLYEKTVNWFEILLRSAPYQLRTSTNVYVASPQLTGQNLRMTSIKTFVCGLLAGFTLTAFGALLATLNIVNTLFTMISIFCATLMAGSLIFTLQWKIGVYEDVILAVFLVPLVAKGPLFTAMSFRRYFYMMQSQSGALVKATEHLNVQPILRASLRHSVSVLTQSLIFASLLSVPLLFENNFTFALRLAQFIAIASASSYLVAIFCLMPLLSRFAFTTRRYGIASVYNSNPYFPQNNGSKRKNSYNDGSSNNSPPSSASPKSGSTSSGPVSSSSQRSNNNSNEEAIVVNVQHLHKTLPRKSSLISNNSSTFLGRKQAEIRKINTSELYSSGIFSSKSNGHIPKALEQLIPPQSRDEAPLPGTSELIWVPRFPTAGVPLEEFRILNSPTPSDASPPPLLPRCSINNNNNNNNNSNNMAMSWSAASTSFSAVAALQHLEREFRHPNQKSMINNNGHATIVRPPSQSRSFQNGATTLPFLMPNNSNKNSLDIDTVDVDINTNNTSFLFSPSYHTISSGGIMNNSSSFHLLGQHHNSSTQFTQ